ncbi:hypothetical protein PIB30_086433 [Stylosanthes scabra]|uniref:Uncharacterized protein n=1 Tax=Stylosanthes scabra TaxID=79078 RepID=A0ABU6XQJ7_9FABA|nr:hypothetical protein [Stylosanthes scabra]
MKTMKERQKKVKRIDLRDEVNETQRPSSDEDIEDAVLEVEETWEAGRRAGIETDIEVRAKKYLLLAIEVAEEIEAQSSRRLRKGARGKKTREHKLGGSENLHP